MCQCGNLLDSIIRCNRASIVSCTIPDPGVVSLNRFAGNNNIYAGLCPVDSDLLLLIAIEEVALLRVDPLVCLAKSSQYFLQFLQVFPF